MRGLHCVRTGSMIGICSIVYAILGGLSLAQRLERMYPRALYLHVLRRPILTLLRVGWVSTHLNSSINIPTKVTTQLSTKPTQTNGYVTIRTDVNVTIVNVTANHFTNVTTITTTISTTLDSRNVCTSNGMCQYSSAAGEYKCYCAAGYVTSGLLTRGLPR